MGDAGSDCEKELEEADLTGTETQPTIETIGEAKLSILSGRAS